MTADGSVQVLTKAAAVLDRLAREQEASARQLADWLDEPRSTVYRLLANLRRLGFVEPGSRRGSYRLGLELFRLGSAVLTRFDERQAALPVMERIHEETGETVFLCVRRGLEAVCIERLDGRRVQSLALRVGGSLPLHAGAAPRVLLAYAQRDLWRDYVSATPLERLTPHTPTTAEDLVPMLEQIRRVGYAVSDEDVTVGIAALGAPIFDYRGTLRAALSISGLRSMILGAGSETIRALVIDGARDVSQALGHGTRQEALADA